MTTWLRDALHIPAHSAKHLTTLGDLLHTRPALADAMSTGDLTAAQAQVIGDTIDDLTTDLARHNRSASFDPTDAHEPPDPFSPTDPTDLLISTDLLDPPNPKGHAADDTAGLITACETALVNHAADLEPSALRTAGSRILAYLAPDLADTILKAKLDREEAHAHRTRTLTLTPIGHGQTRLTAVLDTESIATLRAALEPLTRPVRTHTHDARPDTRGHNRYADTDRPRHATYNRAGTSSPDDHTRDDHAPDRDAAAPDACPPGTRDLRSLGQRRADALIDICRLALATDTLPDHGGQRPHLVITLDYDTVTRQIGAGTLDTGELLSPATIRRLACDAHLIPAILGSHSETLDLGRSRRLFTGPIRRALVLRDRGCAFPGCDRPPHWCDGHHITAWHDGGATTLPNAVLLCRHHHHTIHQNNGWQVRINTSGLPEFLPPEYIDPLQRPQRNIYHQRT